LPVLALFSCAGPRFSSGEPAKALGVSLDFSGVDAWLACAGSGGAPGACAWASEVTWGGRLAKAAEGTFGDVGLAEPAVPTTGEVRELVGAMRRWPDPSAAVTPLLPAVVPGPISIHVVANGHPAGDAYVRKVRVAEGGAPELSDSGNPTVILNALLISGYKGTSPERAASALGVLRHEIFHVLFARFRDQDPGWQSLGSDLSPTRQLELILLNEGIAHWVDRRERLAREGFPPERARAALSRLAEAFAKLAALPEGSAEAQTILEAANQGQYWDKFGSIAGMLLAEGTFQSRREKGLREAARCGTGKLFAGYGEAAARNKTLPPLPPGLLGGREPLDLCGGPRR
jgi:hypothetical protein